MNSTSGSMMTTMITFVLIILIFYFLTRQFTDVFLPLVIQEQAFIGADVDDVLLFAQRVYAHAFRHVVGAGGGKILCAGVEYIKRFVRQY